MSAEYPKYSALIKSADLTVKALKDRKFLKNPVVQVAPGDAPDNSNTDRRSSLGKWLYGLEQGLGHTDPRIDPKTAVNLKDAITIPATGLQLALMARMVEQTWVSEGRRFPASRIHLMDRFEDVLDLPHTYLGDRANLLLDFFRSFEPAANPTPQNRVEDPNKPDHPYDSKLRDLLHRCSLFYVHSEELEKIRSAAFEAARNQIRGRLMDNKGLYHDDADFLAYYTASNAGMSKIAAVEMLRDTLRVNRETDDLIFQPFGTIVEISAYEMLSRQANSLARHFQFNQVLTGINPKAVPWENVNTHPLVRAA